MISSIRQFPVQATVLICAIAMAVVTGTILIAANERHDYWNEQYFQDMRPAIQLSELRVSSRQIRSKLWRMVALQVSASRTETLNDIKANIARLDSSWNDYYDAGITSADEQQIASQIATALPKRRQIAERGSAYLASGNYAALSQWLVANASFVAYFDELVTKDIEINLAQAKQNGIRIDNAFYTMQWVLMILLALSAAAAVILLVWITRNRANLMGKVRYHTALASRLFEITSNSVMFTDALGTIEKVNSAFTKMTGYAPDEVIGKNPRLLHSGRQSPEFYRDMWHCLRSKGRWSGAMWNRRKNGEIYLEEQTITAVCEVGNNVSTYIKISRDVTTDHQQRDHLRKLAMHDALTGLYNRLGLGELLRRAILQAQRRGSRLAVFLIDLDGFKQINDAHGHAAGDDVLNAVAGRMRGIVRGCDTLARLGGDEFVVVLEDIGESDHVDRIAKALVRKVAQPIALGDATVQVTTSIGISFYPEHGTDVEQLLLGADVAMYIAKGAGKNRFWIYDPRHAMELPLASDESRKTKNPVASVTLERAPHGTMPCDHGGAVERGRPPAAASHPFSP